MSQVRLWAICLIRRERSLGGLVTLTKHMVRNTQLMLLLSYCTYHIHTQCICAAAVCVFISVSLKVERLTVSL